MSNHHNECRFALAAWITIKEFAGIYNRKRVTAVVREINSGRITNKELAKLLFTKCKLPKLGEHRPMRFQYTDEGVLVPAYGGPLPTLSPKAWRQKLLQHLLAHKSPSLYTTLFYNIEWNWYSCPCGAVVRTSNRSHIRGVRHCKKIQEMPKDELVSGLRNMVRFTSFRQVALDISKGRSGVHKKITQYV